MQALMQARATGFGDWPVDDIDLVREAAFLGGEWVPAETGAAIEVADPATGRLIGVVPRLVRLHAEAAVRHATQAFPAWRRRLAKERGRILARWAELMTASREDLARIMTLEQGKPLAEARGEIDYAASFLAWYAAEAERVAGELLQTHLPDRRLLVQREPVGVTAAITPWNFPSAMITRKAGAALAAGCTMIVKPSEETPFSALALAVLAERAGVPAGVFQVITGDARAIGAVLTERPEVRAISFTGSTRVGKALLAASAETVKTVSLELGGHAPFLVFADADLPRAIADAVAAKFQTTGQDCLAANRILVERPVYDRFVEGFTARARALRIGNGFDDGVELGPLMNQAAVAKCRAQVEDAIGQGARLLSGGEVLPLGPLFYAATVLADVTPEMIIFREETFGPVAAITPFDTEEEAVRLTNDTAYGLAAYLYTTDMRRSHRLPDRLDYGMVAVNTARFTGAPVPFGGVKQSGLGREGSRHGIDAFTELKYICLATD